MKKKFLGYLFFAFLIFSYSCPGYVLARHRYTPTPTCTETATETPTPMPWSGEKLYVFDSMWGSKGANINQLNIPEGLAIGPDGLLYIADTANNRILVWDTDGKPVTSYGSFGTSATWRNPPQFNHPTALLVLPPRKIYVSDTLNNRIVVLDENGLVVSSWGSQGNANGQFNTPHTILKDHYGNIWVLDTGNSRVENFSNMGVFNFTWGSYGTQPGFMNLPWGIALNNIDQAIVADTGNFRMEVFNDQSSATTNTAPVTVQGWYGEGPYQFKEPSGVAVTPSGVAAITDGIGGVVDFYNSRNGDFEFLSLWRAKDEILNENFLPRFRGIASDSQNRLYITDIQNNVIIRLKPKKDLSAPPTPAPFSPTPTEADTNPYGGAGYPIR